MVNGKMKAGPTGPRVKTTGYLPLPLIFRSFEPCQINQSEAEPSLVTPVEYWITSTTCTK